MYGKNIVGPMFLIIILVTLAYYWLIIITKYVGKRTNLIHFFFPFLLPF